MPNNALQSLISRNRSIFFQRAEMFDVTRPWYVDANDMSLNAGGGAFKASQNGLFITDNTSAPVFTAIAVNGTYYNSEAMTIGDVMMGDNGSGKANVLFDQSAGKLYFRKATTSVLSIGTGIDGQAQIDGIMNIGASGGFFQGVSGSFSTPTNGWKLYISSDDPVMEWHNGDASVPSMTLSPSDGIEIQCGASFETEQAVNFIGASDRRMGAVYGYTDDSSYNAVRLEAYTDDSTYVATCWMHAQGRSPTATTQTYQMSGYWDTETHLSYPDAYVYTYANANTTDCKVQFVAETSGGSQALLSLHDNNGTKSWTAIGVTKSWRIDHPLKPTTHWLDHATVEGPEHYTFYRGNVTLDKDGRATVQMPDWFDALNTDVSYQLTPIGAPSPDLHISREIDDTNSFDIAGGADGLKVSWLMSGLRDDVWAVAHPVRVETPKDGDEIGFIAAWQEHGLDDTYRQPSPRDEEDPEKRNSKPRPPTPQPRPKPGSQEGIKQQ